MLPETVTLFKIKIVAFPTLLSCAWTAALKNRMITIPDPGIKKYRGDGRGITIQKHGKVLSFLILGIQL